MWNPIEHRLFSEISKNWVGHPLDSYLTVKNYISTTRTSTGLLVKAYIDQKDYQTGVKISDAEM
jgi:Rhodopirellula transposase DDE domain